MSEQKSGDTLGLVAVAAGVLVVGFLYTAWANNLKVFSWFNKGSYEECYIEQINNAKTAKAAQLIHRSAIQMCSDKYPKKFNLIKPIDYGGSKTFTPIPSVSTFTPIPVD